MQTLIRPALVLVCIAGALLEFDNDGFWAGIIGLGLAALVIIHIICTWGRRWPMDVS